MKTKKTHIKVLSAFAMTTFIAGAFLIFACGKVENPGEFSEDRLIVSKGDIIDVSEFYEGKENVSFISLDESIVDFENDQFIGVGSGLTFIYAVTDGVKGDYIEVYVKDEFSTPQGISLDESGLITWNNVYSFVDDDQCVAKYELIINGETISSEANSYQLNEKGEYSVKIRALGQELIDSSTWSEEYTLYYNKMGKPDNIVFTPSENPASMEGVLTWDNVDGAKYKVTVDGVVYYTYNNRLNMNFENFSRGSTNIIIEAIDINERYMSTSNGITLKRVASPTISYNKGELTWSAVEGAEKYNVFYVKDGVEKFFTTTELSTTLEGVDEGIYSVYVQALASGNNINSIKREFSKKVAKLGTSEVEYILGDDYVDVKISTTSTYLKNFKILANGDEWTATITDGNEVTTQIPLNVGVYDFKVQSLPTFNGDEVVALGNVNEVIPSNYTSSKRIYVLGNAENYIHSFDNDGNSILEFDKIENAESYEFFVNEKKIEDVILTASSEKILVNLGKIDRKTFEITDGSVFNIDVFAKRTSDTINSKTSKRIEILTKSIGKGANGSDIESKSYVWNRIEHAKYEINLYRASDNQYNIEGIQPILSRVVESPSTGDLSAGYYVLKIKTLTTDCDKYWDSEEIEIDNFIISEKEENPYFLDFYYDQSLSSDFSGYGIKFKIPAVDETNYKNPRKYQIFVNETDESTLNDVKIVDSEALTTEQILTYNFSKDYKFNSGTTKIVLRLICNDEESSQIYKPSELSILFVEKLEKPSEENISIEGDNTLKASLSGNAREVVFLKDNVAFENSGNYLQEIDLSAFIGSFDIDVYYNTYKSFITDEEFTSGNYYIESEKFVISCKRDEIPRNLSYYKKIISFEHSGVAEKYNLIVKIKTKNDPVGKTWSTQIEEKSYNLDNLISVLGDEFANYYSQKVEMDIDIYSFVTQFIDGTYYIPSINSTETSRGMAHINVTQLKNVSDLTYNKLSDKLTWSSTNPDDTTYEVYLNDELYKSINSYSNEGDGIYSYECSLADLVTDPGENYEFKIIATKTNSFDSNVSNQVTVKKLNSLRKINVYTDPKTEKVYIEWDLTSEQVNLIEKIVINGTEINVTEQIGRVEVSDEIVRMQLISKGTENSTLMYRDSDTTVFTVRVAVDLDYSELITGTTVKKQTDWLEVEDLNESYIEWNVFVDDNVWSGTSAKVNYIFKVYKDGNLFKEIDVGNSNRIELNNETLKNLPVGTYSFNVYAFMENYELNDKEQGSYLSKYLSNSNIPMKNLNSVKELTYAVDTTLKENYDEELAKNLTVSWDHDDYTSEMYYVVYFVNSKEDVVLTKTAKGIKNISVKLSELSLLDVKYIRVIPYSSSDLFGMPNTIQVSKNESPSAELSDEGKLTITSGSVSNRYIVRVEMKGSSKDYILENLNTLNIYEFFKIDEVAGNIKEQKEDLKLSIISIGDAGTLPSESKEIIEKEILGPGAYDVYGEYIFFRNDLADGVHVLYKNENGTIEDIEITQKELLYKSSNNENYDYYAGLMSGLSTNPTSYMGGFRFKIPEEWKGGNISFNYYFYKSGMGNSWTDTGFTSCKNITVSDSGTISGVKFSMDATTNNISGELISTAEVSEVFAEISYGSVHIYGYFKGNTIPIWNLEENIPFGMTLPCAEYKFKVWSISKGVDATSFSNAYEFTYVKNENTISSVVVGESGYLEWSDSESDKGKYLIECGDENFITEENKFDLILLNKHSFTLTIKKIYDIPCGGSVTTTEENKTIRTVTDPVVVQSSTMEFTDRVELSEITNDAEVILSVPDRIDYHLFMEYNGKTYAIPDDKVVKDYEENKYLRVREIDLIDVLGKDFNNNISEIKLAITETGKVKSPSISVSLNLYKNDENINGSIKQVKAGNNFDEYLIYSSNLKNPTKAILRITTNNEVIYDGLNDLVKGYWVTMSNSELNGFYTLLPDNCKSSEEVYVIKISDLLNEINIAERETYIVEVAPIHVNTSAEQVEWLSTKASYQRLSGVSKININSDGSKITWQDNDRDENLTEYLVIYNDKKYYISKDVFEISSSEFEAGVSGEFKVYGISNEIGKLYSISESLSNLEKNKGISQDNIIVENGVLKISWGTGLTSEETAKLNDKDTRSATIAEIFATRDFMKVVQMTNILAKENNFGNPLDYADKLTKIRYNYPINFTMDSLKDEKIELKFNKDGSTKSITVKAVDLLEPIEAELITALGTLKDSVNGGERSYAILSKFINLSGETGLFYGIASDEILFDDVANDVDPGVYSLNINQWGLESIKTLKSEDSAAISSLEVVASPVTTAVREEIKQSDTVLASKYYIKFTGNSNSQYKIVFRKATDNNRYEVQHVFEIKYDSTKWKIYKDADVLLTLKAEETASGSQDYDVIIPINTIADQVGLYDKVEFGDFEYDVNIYKCGGENKLNSKTQPIKLLFLKHNDIEMREGKASFILYQYGDKIFDPAVVYKISNNNNIVTGTVEINGSIVSYKPSELSSSYDYIYFYTKGKINGNEMYVDSSIYMIENPVKLQSPNVNVEDGAFVITEKDTTNAYQKAYWISNNKNSEGMPIGPDIGSKYTYYPGESNYGEGEYLEYKESEKAATEFYFQNMGSSGKLASNDKATAQIDGNDINVYVLKFDDQQKVNETVLFQSEQVTVEARMLKDIESCGLNTDGDFEWTVSDKSNAGNCTASNYKLLYKVTVEYSVKEDNNGNIEQWGSEVVYTSKNIYESNNLQKIKEAIDKYHFRISVSAMYYAKEGSKDKKITTLEGEDYYISNDIGYNDNNGFILRSNTVKTDNLTRLKEVEDLEISEGKIKWTYDSGKTKDNFKIYATDSNEKILLDGVLESTGTSYKFTPITELESKKYGLIVKVVGGSETIPSQEKIYENEFMKLPEAQRKNITVKNIVSKNGSIQYTFDFSGYAGKLNSNSGGSKDYFVLKVKIFDSEGNVLQKETGLTPSTNMRITVDSNWNNTVKVEIKAEAGEGQKDIINSESVIFDYKRLDWTGKDKAEPINWDGDNKLLSWRIGKTAINYIDEDTEAYTRKYSPLIKIVSKPEGYSIDKMILQKTWAEWVEFKYVDEGEETIYYVKKSDYEKTNSLTDDILLYSSNNPEEYSISNMEYIKSWIEWIEFKYTAEGKDPLTYYVKKVDYEANNGLTEDMIIYSCKETKVTKWPEEINLEKIIEQSSIEGGITGLLFEGTDEIYYVKQTDVKSKDVYISPEDKDNIKFDVEIVTQEGNTSLEYYEITRVYSNIPYDESIDGGCLVPILSGNIIKVSIYVKYGEDGLYTSALTLDSEIDLTTFAGGDGTANNPYLIETAEQFLQINKVCGENFIKTYTETKFKYIVRSGVLIDSLIHKDKAITHSSNYFKQMKDIELTSSGTVIGDFDGVYDGNGKKITINAESPESDNIQASGNYDLNGRIDFNRGVAIFKTIKSGGVVKNILLNAQYEYSADANTIFAGVAVVNEGTVSNVTCEEFGFKFVNSINSIEGMFISTIVGINKERGLVENCTNTSNIKITNSDNISSSTILLVSGIVSSNYGNIIGSGNSGDIGVLVQTNKVDVRLAGVAGYNGQGKLIACYNSGTLKSQRGNGTKYGRVAGIVNYANGGLIDFSFNSGKIFGSDEYCGGIVYYAGLITLKEVFAYGEVNDSKENLLYRKSSNLSIESYYSYSGATKDQNGKTIEASGDISNASYSAYKISVVRNSATDFALTLKRI